MTSLNSKKCSNYSCSHAVTTNGARPLYENGGYAVQVVVPLPNGRSDDVSFTSRQLNCTPPPPTTAEQENCFCKNLQKKKSHGAMSDRLGQWPTGADSEVAGNLSGLQRLHNGRYNKVRKSLEEEN